MVPPAVVKLKEDVVELLSHLLPLQHLNFKLFSHSPFFFNVLDSVIVTCRVSWPYST